MRTAEQTITDTTTMLSRRLAGWGVDAAPEKAAEFVRWLTDNGWKATRHDPTPTPAVHDPDAARLHLAAARAEIAAARARHADD